MPCGGGAERTCENDTLIVYASYLLHVLFIVCYVNFCVDGIKHDAGSVDFPQFVLIGNYSFGIDLLHPLVLIISLIICYFVSKAFGQKFNQWIGIK